MAATDGNACFEFQHLPPFPANVPTAPLLRLSLQKLLDGDEVESDRLRAASCELGFFYLDVVGAKDGELIDGDAFIKTADKLFGVAAEFFDLPVDEKQKYDFAAQGSYFGYKGYGASIIDKQGRKDKNEFYNVSKDDILDISPALPAPALLTPYRPLFSKYIHTSHAVVTVLLKLLNGHLGLPPGTLPALHRLDHVSGDQIRFVKSPPQPLSNRQAALGAHTDYGSITLLWNRLGGLQILPPGAAADRDSAWLYVKPLRGCCVVNLGDALVKMTSGLLRSNMHRVVNPPALQQDSTRFSLVYFARPEDNVVLRPLQGSDLIDQRTAGDSAEEAVTSKEWIIRRALGRRSAASWEMSMGTEQVR